MAKIEWAQLCELAFLDNCDRLCLVGVTTRFPVPSLPILVRQIMIAARVVDVLPGETITISISMTAPNGLAASSPQGEGFEVGVAGEYVLITLREVPFAEEGIFRFAISLGEEDPVTLRIPVMLVPERSRPEFYTGDHSTSGPEQKSRSARRDLN